MVVNEPPKQLKGFRKVFLQPGETQQVTFSLSPRDLSYWDSKAHDWVMPVGDYKIMVGSSSRDIAASDTIRVEKTTGPRYLTTTTKSIVEPGTSVPVTTSFTNESSYAVQNMSLELTVPDGWNAHVKGQVRFDSVPSGKSVSVEWVVDIPTAVKPGDHQLTGSASYQAPDEGQHSVDAATVSVPYNSLAEAFNNVGITDDANHEPGNFDGVHNSYSAQALAKVGITPGSHLTAGGIEFTWPNVPAGTLDNVKVEGQLIRFSGSGSKLGFLGAGEQGTYVGDEQATFGGTGTILYTDGSTQEFALTLPGWSTNVLPAANDLVASMPYLNRNRTTAQNKVRLYIAYVPLGAGKTVQYVKLPNASIHVFDMKLK
jgi:beta-glucosidase